MNNLETRYNPVKGVFEIYDINDPDKILAEYNADKVSDILQAYYRTE